MKRMFLSLLLVLCTVLSLLPQVSAASFETSDKGIALIKEYADSFSSSRLSNTESAVNKFLTNNSITVNQAQFDALVSLIYDIGTGNLSASYRYAKAIMDPEGTEVELADAWCAWVKSGGVFSEKMLENRIRELKLYCYGDYTGKTTEHEFRYVVFKANGGTLEDNTVICYALGEPYRELPLATYKGKYFAGWYTTSSGGSHVHNDTVVKDDLTVYARWSTTEIEDPNTGNSALPKVKTSDEGIAFIKLHEGFCKYAVWDVSQWTVGYGTRCGVKRDGSDVPDEWKEGGRGITEEEADFLFRTMLAEQFEPVVDRVFAKSPRKYTQAQYDAMVDFSFNLGTSWASSGYNLYRLLVSGDFTEMEFVNVLGRWCNVSGKPSNGTARRRISEANMFFNNQYVRNSTAYLRITYNTQDGDCDTDYYYYKTGVALGELPTATRDGYTFMGWYTAANGAGTRYTPSTLACTERNITVYAYWVEGEATKPTEPPTQPPTEPVEPTEPTDPPTQAPTEPEEPTEPGWFVDVPKGVWYYNGVKTAVELGVFNGISSTQFAPDATMTRAMMVTALYNLRGKPETTATTPFEDVAQGQWYSKPVAWAYENGLVTGISETEFDLNSEITREQLATLLFRYAEKFDASTDMTARADLTSFDDWGQVHSFALEGLQWAVAHGFIKGISNNLVPEGNAPRAQCAVLLTRYLGYDT